MKKIFSSGLMVALLLNLFGNCAFAENDADSGGSIFSDGMENLNKIYDKSDSFMVKVDTDTPDDMYRIYKTSLERQYIVYKSEKAISGYRIKAYNALGLICTCPRTEKAGLKANTFLRRKRQRLKAGSGLIPFKRGKFPKTCIILRLSSATV